MCIYSHKQTSIDIERLATKTMLMADFGETIFGRDRTYIHSSDKSTEELVFHESIISMFEYYLKRCPGSKLYHEKVMLDLLDFLFNIYSYLYYGIFLMLTSLLLTGHRVNCKLIWKI